MNVLDELLGEEIQTEGFAISTATALRIFLQQREEVRDLREALRSNRVTPTHITEFVEELLQSFRKGEKFEDELALAAIAVSLENYSVQFAEEYIQDLANLSIKEMPLAPRVARLCLANRHNNIIANRFGEKSFSGLIAGQALPFALVGHARPISTANYDEEIRFKAAS